MKKAKKPEPATLCVEGNNGGSYVRITETEPDYVHLEVGETCVVTIDHVIHVAALAAVLTRAKDIGINVMLKDLGWDEEWIERWGTLVAQRGAA